MPYMFSMPPKEMLTDMMENPGSVTISPDGKQLYVSGSYGNLTMFYGEDFNTMTDDELTRWILKTAASLTTLYSE